MPVDMRALLILVHAASAFAQSIQYDSGRKVWLLTTRQSSYAMGVSPPSGAYLMNRGLNVNLRGDFDSTAIILERQLMAES